MLLQEIITMYKHPFPCPLHSWYRYIPFGEAIFLPFALFFTLQRKQRLPQITWITGKSAGKQKLKRLVSCFHGAHESGASPIATPLAILGFSFIHTFHSLGEAFVRDFTDHQREDRKKPHLFSYPNHLPSSTEAQHCTANGKAGNSIRAHPLHRTIQCTEKTDRASQLS